MGFGKFVMALVAALVTTVAAPAAAQAGKKVLFVNSYHQGYEWSDGIEKGAQTALAGSGVELRFHRMDTKRNQDDAFRKQAGEKARVEIEAWKPDLVIVADDMAVKYLLQPFYKDAKLPFVFCGVNWDAGRYSMPYKNTTGMVEVTLVKELVGKLREYARGNRLGFLTADSETERIEGPYYKKQLGIEFTAERYVKNMAEWKDAFLKMQGEVDALFFGNYSGISDWNEAEAKAFVQANSKVISGSVYDYMMPFVMLGLTKMGEEQGVAAGQAALAILKGAAPASLPVTQNKQAKILLNPALASKAGVLFKHELVRTAQVYR
jgi:ABC-type uncharacterized transport system substrate-binding protein